MSHQYVRKNWDVLLVGLAPKVRKQSVSNTRVDPGGKYGCTSCPKRVLSWVVAHLPSRTMHEVPELRGASILREICFELAGRALSRIVHFVSRHALRWLQGPNGVHSRIQ